MKPAALLRIGCGLVAACMVLNCAAAMAQVAAEPWRESPRAPASDQAIAPAQPSAGPDQPVVPRWPMIERRVLPPQGPLSSGPSGPGTAYPLRGPAGPGQTPPAAPLPVPFVLSPEETAQLDGVLMGWEQRNKEIKSFECTFTMWKYDSVFGTATKPKSIDRGVIKYTAPDKGRYEIEGKQPVLWICDGKAFYEYKYEEKQVIEHRLPPEVQGKGLAENGPLPFVFGNEAQRLKQRYFLKIITPADTQGEIWLEAFPRWQRDAADFQRAQLILKANGMLPTAIQLFSPNGKDRTVYHFDDVVVNRRWRNLLLESDPFRASVPFGWKRVIEDPPGPQVGRAPAGPRR